MFKNNLVFTVSVLIFTFVFFGCGQKGPKKETITLPSGEKLERISMMENPDVEKLMTHTISGKIEVVSNHPSPATLTEEQRRGTEFVSIVTTDGERVFVVRDTNQVLRKNNGKNVTIAGMLNREPAVYQSKTHKMYDLKKIVEIK